MNAPAWLVQWKAQQALEDATFVNLSDFDTFALLVGRVTVFVIASVLLFGVCSASYRWIVKTCRGWFVKPAKKETPCTCMESRMPGWENTTTGATAIHWQVSRIVDPHCPTHGHPSYGITPVSRKSQSLRETGGGDLSHLEEKQKGLNE